MIQHTIQSRDTRARPVSERLSVLVVLQSAFDSMQDPGVVERVSEDINLQRLQDLDGDLDVVDEVEDDEVGLLESVGGGEAY